ncbi:MAG: hypothetical protein IJO16_03230, partial [Clostridia bacterium]|nr:hypothetical protein [Clostridia bacterium]
DDFNATLVTYEDGIKGSIAKAENGIKTFFGNNDGREIKLIDQTGDGKWDTAVFASVAYDKVGYINAANHTLRMNTFSIDGGTATAREEAWEKVNFVDSIAKNDIVKVTKDFSTGKEITVIELVDVVAGTLTKLTSGGVATIDGSTYEKSTKVVDDFTLEVKSTAKNYFVDGKYVVWSDNISSTEEVPSNLALLVDAGEVKKTDSFGNDATGVTTKVEVVLNDGTKAVYTYDASITTGAMAWADLYANEDVKLDVKHAIFEYVMKDSKIALKDLGSDDVAVAGTSKFVKKDVVVKNNGTTYRTNEDTYFFVIDGTKYSVVKASELKTDANLASKNVVIMKDGFSYAVAAAVEATVSGDNKVYLTATSYNTEYSEADEKNVVYFDVTDLEGNVVTLKLEEAPTMLNAFVKYTVDADGFATLKGHNDSEEAGLWWTDMGYSAGAVTYFDETAALINGVEYEFASDMEIYYVDAFVSSSRARLAISEGDGLVLAAEKDNNTYEKNVRFALEDGKISKIIVEVNGEFIWNADKLYGTDVTESYYVAE